MTAPAEVQHFPKRCKHGVPLVRVRKFSGSEWWEPGDCAPCQEAKAAQEDAAEAAMDAWLDRISARLRGL